MTEVPWRDSPSPAEATERWHREARERDEAYLALGPVDDTETTDSPWSGGSVVTDGGFLTRLGELA